MMSDTPHGDSLNSAEASGASPGGRMERQPHRVRLPSFTKEDVGLGDVIKLAPFYNRIWLVRR